MRILIQLIKLITVKNLNDILIYFHLLSVRRFCKNVSEERLIVPFFSYTKEHSIQRFVVNARSKTVKDCV